MWDPVARKWYAYSLPSEAEEVLGNADSENLIRGILPLTFIAISIPSRSFSLRQCGGHESL